MRDTQRTLALYWSFVASLMLGFILYKYGDKIEILTLVIGLLSGTVIGGIFGTFFSANHMKNTPPGTTSVDIQSTAKNNEQI